MPDFVLNQFAQYALPEGLMCIPIASMATFGEKFNLLMTKKGFTTRTLVKKAHVGSATLTKIRALQKFGDRPKGARGIRPDSYIKIAKAFGVGDDVEDLIAAIDKSWDEGAQTAEPEQISNDAIEAARRAFASHKIPFGPATRALFQWLGEEDHLARAVIEIIRARLGEDVIARQYAAHSRLEARKADHA